ncbi:MAG: hypothetical protein ACFFAO_19860, partial [Candidatus Hermodarchaeota archaeon]
LSINTSSKEEVQLNKIIEDIFETIKAVFMTIGIPKRRLNLDLNETEQFSKKNKTKYSTLYDLIEDQVKFKIDKILLEILIEYLFNIDETKVQNLYLFDLISKQFLDHIDKFKKDYISSTQVRNILKDKISNIDNFINPSDFSVDLKFNEIQVPKFSEVPTKILKNSSITNEEITETKEKPNLEIQEKPISFLDYFGGNYPLAPKLINKFNINKENLINYKEIDPQFFDLRNLYYYLSIIKMLNIELPFSKSQIIEIIKNFINNNLFCANSNAKFDPINNFYGLGILSYINLKTLEKDELINIYEIGMHLESELIDFMPEKLHINFYTFLCLKLLKQMGSLIANKSYLANPILNYDIKSKLENYNPISDIFEHLASLKLLDNTINFNHFKSYKEELKKFLSDDQLHKYTITESAQLLLVFDLLNLKDLEFSICQKLFNNMTTLTKFFNSEDLKNTFNWKINKNAFTVELRMLFWALLASSSMTSGDSNL